MSGILVARAHALNEASSIIHWHPVGLREALNVISENWTSQ